MTDKDTEYRELCKRLMETSVEDLHGYAAVEVGQLMGEASEALESMQAEIVRLRAESAELREHAEHMVSAIALTADHHGGDARLMSKCPMCMAADTYRYRAWKEGKK